MKPHVKIYLEAFGYDTGDPGQFIPSELSGKKSVTIHHIIGRGRGGKDHIENLIALTMAEHRDYGEINVMIPTLLLEHRKALIENNIDFDNDWFEEKLLEYSGKS